MGWRRAAVGTFGRRLARCSVSATDLTRPDRANGSPFWLWCGETCRDRIHNLRVERQTGSWHGGKHTQPIHDCTSSAESQHLGYVRQRTAKHTGPGFVMNPGLRTNHNYRVATFSISDYYDFIVGIIVAIGGLRPVFIVMVSGASGSAGRCLAKRQSAGVTNPHRP